MRIYLNKNEIEKMREWKECPESLKEKLKFQEVFLIEVFNTSSGTYKYEIYDEPQTTNMSHEIRISGWLGTSNNINRTALGKFSSIPEAINSVDEKLEEGDSEFECNDHLLYVGFPIK